MSQHRINSSYEGCPATVLLGWDRRLQCFFMAVTCDVQHDTRDDEDDDGIVYSNLNEHDAFDKDLTYFRSKWTALGIQVPAAMFDQVELDRAANAGNRCVSYASDGSFTQA